MKIEDIFTGIANALNIKHRVEGMTYIFAILAPGRMLTIELVKNEYLGDFHRDLRKEIDPAERITFLTMPESEVFVAFTTKGEVFEKEHSSNAAGYTKEDGQSDKDSYAEIAQDIHAYLTSGKLPFADPQYH